MSAPRDVAAPALDAVTLREVERGLAEMAESAGRGMNIGAVMNHIHWLATEAEARAPDLADWVTAATRSRLGVPGVETSDDFDCGGLSFTWQGGAVHVDVSLDGSGAVVDPSAHNGGSYEVATPAALRAALDALAASEVGT